MAANPWVLLALLGAWGASLGGTAWYFEGVGENNVIARQARDDQVRQQTLEAAQAGAAAAIAANKPVNQTIVQKVQREVQTNTIYRDCKLPPAGLRLANEAITGRAESAGGGVVPGAKAVGR
jgi:hypothetical protein